MQNQENGLVAFPQAVFPARLMPEVKRFIESLREQLSPEEQAECDAATDVLAECVAMVEVTPLAGVKLTIKCAAQSRDHLSRVIDAVKDVGCGGSGNGNIA